MSLCFTFARSVAKSHPEGRNPRVHWRCGILEAEIFLRQIFELCRSRCRLSNAGALQADTLTFTKSLLTADMSCMAASVNRRIPSSILNKYSSAQHSVQMRLQQRASRAQSRQQGAFVPGARLPDPYVSAQKTAQRSMWSMAATVTGSAVSHQADKSSHKMDASLQVGGTANSNFKRTSTAPMLLGELN